MPKSLLTDLIVPRPMAGACVSGDPERDAFEASYDVGPPSPPARVEHPALTRLEQLAREELAALTAVTVPDQRDLLEICLGWDLAQSGEPLPGGDPAAADGTTHEA